MARDYSEDPVGRFEDNMRAGEALRPSDMRASATRYRQLADGVLDHFHALQLTADDCEEEVPEGLDELRLKGERLRGYADQLLAFADRAEATKSIVARFRGLPLSVLDEQDKRELAKSLQELYGPLPEAFGLVGG
ncbi:MAG: hypothetical protein ACRC20_15960 [Segniliparus sp.]|uniref:hypothetical protein n=1 Tax=Segniliparus sp. TaxID=2804064 RepID=UPI003F34A7D8